VEADACEVLQRRLVAADDVAAELATHAWQDTWCASTLRGSRRGAGRLLDLLEAARRTGCEVELGVEDGEHGWELQATATSAGSWTLTVKGLWEDVVDDAATAAKAETAVDANDLRSALDLVPALDIEVVVRVRLPVEELAWVRTVGVLTDLVPDGWMALARLVASIPSGHGHLVIATFEGSALVRTPGLVVHGPDEWPEAPDASRRTSGRSKRRLAHEVVAVAPPALLPEADPPPELAAVDSALRQVAGALAWWAAAGTSEVVEGLPVVAIEAGQVLIGPLTACPPQQAGPSVDLWTWGFSDDRPGRREAVLRSAGLQADTVGELYERAASILQTAVFLAEVAESGLVREALTARRDARSAAIAAGREAADGARTAARATVDRVLVVMAGGVGIVLANRAAVVEDAVAYGLLGLVVALAVGAALLALVIDLPSARRGVRIFRAELASYEEVLSDADVGRVAQMPSLRDAVCEVDRARRVVLAVLAVLVVATAGLGIAIATGDGSASTTTTTTTTTTP
jgi:hypothetical protein